MDNKIQAIGYVRVSTDEQQLGIEAQKKSILDYCNKNNIELVEFFEEHISGGAELEEREILLNAIDKLDSKINLLLVARRDRIARDMYVAVVVDKLVERQKAKLLVVDEPINNTPEFQLMKTILTAFSVYERAIIKLRIKRAMEIKRQKGESCGTAPFGWKKAEYYGTGPSKQKEPTIILVENEHEQLAIERIKQLGSSGHSLRSCCKILEAEGFKPRKNKWSPNTVKSIIDKILNSLEKEK